MSVINLDVPATARAVFRALWEPSPVEVVRAALEATRARLGLPPLSSAPEAQWLPPRPPPRFVLAEREWDWMY